MYIYISNEVYLASMRFLNFQILLVFYSLHYTIHSYFQKGLARTQIPTNKNYAFEFPTFGEIAGVNHSVVQWSSLALEELPC